MSKSLQKWLALLAAGTLTACATTPTAEVTRFHLGQPIPADSITLVPPAGDDPAALEFRSYADVVGRDLTTLGYRPVAANAAGADSRSAYIGVLQAGQTSRDGPPRSAPFRIGLGAGTGGGGSGVGGGISVPVGKAPSSVIRSNLVALQIKRRSDNSVVWEGRATQDIAADAPAASLSAAVPALSKVLLAGFPGVSGQAVKVKLKP